MIKFKDYFDRKFYSKVGRATHAKSKPQVFNFKEKEKTEISMAFVQSELIKVQSELGKIRKVKKKIMNSSSFLATDRAGYMKAFVRGN